MRVIWWKITRPEASGGPVELLGDSLTLHLPADQSPVQWLNSQGGASDDQWLNRLLAWSDGHESG